jgi:multicomponent Na+:H+ antiporter subunit D
MKAALFMAVGTMIYRVGSPRIEAVRGLGRQMPWTLTAFALAGPVHHRRARPPPGSSASGT